MIDGFDLSSIQLSDVALERAIKVLHCEGFVRIKAATDESIFKKMIKAVSALEELYPNGFINKGVYSLEAMEARTAAPKTTDRAPTAIYPNVGFLAPELLLPLAIPAIRSIVESMVGNDYYLSNTWMQRVPPETGRMAYHKDPRGSVTFILMLDDIDDNMGSTNLIPRSHLNTPPPAYCMSNIQNRHPKEVDLTGNAGDIVFFTPDTWHARAENRSGKSTRRLFYNFYSKSSKSTTSWANAVSKSAIAEVLRIVPELPPSLFVINPEYTISQQNLSHSSKYLKLGTKSHDGIRADIAFSRQIYGQSCLIANGAGAKSYTNRAMEANPFNIVEYLQHFKFVPTSKIAVKRLLNV